MVVIYLSKQTFERVSKELLTPKSGAVFRCTKGIGLGWGGGETGDPQCVHNVTDDENRGTYSAILAPKPKEK